MIVEALVLATLAGPVERDGVRFIGCSSTPQERQGPTLFETFRIEVRRGDLIRWERWSEGERRYVPATHGNGCVEPTYSELGPVTVRCSVAADRYHTEYETPVSNGSTSIDRTTGELTMTAQNRDSVFVFRNAGVCGPTTDPSRRRSGEPRL